MRRISAQYLLQGETAVIEMAQASGLTLLTEEERNPMVTTSYGTGQLVADAVRHGAKHVIIGLGGSATSDAGTGMLRALIDSFAPKGSWNDIEALRDIRFTIASDVKNPLCGKNGAAHVFAPQKGADKDMVEKLDRRAKTFAEMAAKHQHRDCANAPGAGAAGGLGYAFMEFMDAKVESGAEIVLQSSGFDDELSSTIKPSIVITGEGSADAQTLMGKLPSVILKHCKAQHVPVFLVAGRIKDKQKLLDAGFEKVIDINTGLDMEHALDKDVAAKRIGLAMKFKWVSYKK
jgi:glycerate kinase